MIPKIDRKKKKHLMQHFEILFLKNKISFNFFRSIFRDPNMI